jgi:hypothetical protein
MDEAHMLGKGKYFDINGPKDRSEILLDHLNHVCELCDKYGFKPMMWSDMFYRLANGGEYYTKSISFGNEIKALIPENLTLVYWDYYSAHKKHYDLMLDGHKALCDRVTFGGGAWKWSGFTPHNAFSIRCSKAAMTSCAEKGVKDIFITSWGDDGAEASPFSVLPSLCYIAEYAKGNTDEEKIKKKFKSIVGRDYDECMRIDFGNYIAGNERNVTHSRNPSKYMLYADTINDFLDWTVKPGASYKFAEVARDMHALAKKSRKYGYVYETAACLCDAMEIKYELGLKTRAAYEAGNKDELRRLANEDYVEVVKRIDAYGKAHVKQWKKENKFSGLEAIDMRVGAIIRRMQTVRQYILEYCDGKVDSIEPLDQELLAYKNKEESWVFTASLSNMTANTF